MSRSLNGALAGAAAAGVWAGQQPLDKRVFSYGYDDVELLGKLVTRGPAWPAAGVVLHLGAGGLFGAAYAQLRPLVPAPPLASAIALAMVENFGLWPLGALVDRHHPARRELSPLAGARRALAQATWRHLIFGMVLGELERRLNTDVEPDPPEVPASSNGHGDIEAALAAA